MTTLLSGGTGLLGSPLVAQLREQRTAVVLLTRGEVEPGRGRRSEYFQWDPQAGELSPDVFTRYSIDSVIHLAGEPIADSRWTERKKRRILESRVNGTRAIVDAIAKTPVEKRPRVFLSASAIGIYGLDPPGDCVEDITPEAPDYLAHVCREWEAQALRARELVKRVVCLRTGIVLSARGGALGALLPVFKLGLGGPVGGGGQWMSWIHERDWWAAVLHALRSEGIEGPLNLVAPQPVTNREFAATLGEVLGRPSVLPTPAGALRLMLGDRAQLVLHGQRVSSQKLQGSGFRFLYPELREALGSLVAESRRKSMAGMLGTNFFDGDLRKMRKRRGHSK